jgi:CBS domain-containing protein
MSTVKEIFQNKQKTFNTIRSNALVIEAVSMLNSINLSYLIVVENGEYKGIFSERDYARNIILKGRSSSNTLVKEAMTTDLPVVNFHHSIKHCMHLMISHKTRYLLAYDDNKFIGVVTIHDLLRQALFSKDDLQDDDVTHSLINNDEGSSMF